MRPVAHLPLALCAALALALLVPAIGQAALEVGVHAERGDAQTLSRAEVMRLRAGGVTLVRTPLEWELVQREGPDAEYDFTNFDRLIEWATKGDLPQLEIVADLIGSPGWVEGAETNNHPPFTGSDLRLWKRFVIEVVKRYGRDGPIDAWQVWNEPNLKTFWGREPDVGEYAQFLKLTDRAINKGDPDATTVLAGMPQRKDAPKPQVEFLEPLYREKGVEKHFDVVATHPFANNERQVIDAVADVREVMDDARDKRTPIWVTEFGFASAGPRHPFTRSPNGQARALKRVFADLKRKSRRLQLERAFWYTFRDSDTDPPQFKSNDRWQTYAGLFTAEGKPKDSWQAMTDLTGGDPGSGSIEPDPIDEGPLQNGLLDLGILGVVQLIGQRRASL